MIKVKHIISYGFVIAWLSLLSYSAQAIPVVKLVGPESININELFVVSVYVDGVTELDPFLGLDEVLAFAFDVVAPSSINYNGAILGAGFLDDSLLLPDTDIAAHAVPGVSGDDILLADLSFTPTLAGIFNVGIFSDLLDPNEGLFTMLYREDMTSSIVVAAPEPSSLTLLCVGLAIMLSLRKRSQNISE
ncbi:MAG: PEP-CTERM sorting domain-containing protein [Chromatiales bacterium]|jgi:hypothetical protein